MTSYDLKPRFQRILRPLAAWFVRRGIRPNAVTWFGLVLSVSTGGVVAVVPQAPWALLLVPVALLARMTANALDGVMATRHGLATRSGAMLNELADIASDAALYLPFVLVTGSWLVVVVVVFAALTETAGILGRTIGASRRYDGPAGKSDRALTFGLIAVVLAFWTPPRAVLTGVWLLLILLLAATLRNRVRGALQEAT